VVILAALLLGFGYVCPAPDRAIVVTIPEFVRLWYEYLLHTLHGTRLRAFFINNADKQTIIINSP
jgi:hypothetical protein